MGDARAWRVFTTAHCLLPIALIACSHGEPFAAPSHASDEPLVAGAFPVRLTYNRGQDRGPAWLPDGSGIVYSAEQFRVNENDWCVAVLPPTGGRIMRQRCPSGLHHHDSVTALSGAESPNGTLALYRATGLPRTLGAFVRELVVGDWQGTTVTPVISIPFTPPGAPRPFSSVSQIRWLDDTRFVFRGDLSAIRTFDFAPPESVVTGRYLVLVTLGSGAPAISMIPGTDYASSVAVRGSDEILYTIGGDTRVFSRLLSTGDTSTVWDFGGRTARSVQISGDRLLAIVGGAALVFDSLFMDFSLSDAGGFLNFVNLADGSAGVVDQFAIFRNAALSPDGRRLVVESVGLRPDLFLYDLP